LKHIFILGKVCYRYNLGYSPAIWTLNTHHIWATLATKLLETSFTESMSTLQNTGHLDIFVVGEGADLALNFLTLFFLV